MTEKYEVTPAIDIHPAERFSSVLINRISKAREEISAIKATNTWLNDEDFRHVRALHENADMDILTLLSLRRSLDTKIEDESGIGPEESARQTELEQEISVEVEMFPGETIHPFSANRVYIHVPSTKHQDSFFTIFASLTDLRGEGVSDSIQALELIGEEFRSIMISDAHVKKSRINRELSAIHNERELVINAASKYSLRQLSQLTAVLVRQKHNLINV